MKNKIFTLVLTGGLLLMGSACKKDEIAPETTRNVPKATIKGKMFADLDVSSGKPGYENAPSGIKVQARIWSPDLAGGVDTSRVSKSYILYEATTNGSGEYSLEVDASNSGLTVTLYPDDFTYDQIQGINPADSSLLAPIRKVYSAGTQTVSVIAGGTTVRDISYLNSK